MPYGFVTKEFRDLHHVDERMNFATNILLKLVVSHVLGVVHVRTYVNHVKNICHIELANPLTKRILLVIE